MIYHWIPMDTPKVSGRQRAICGAVVDERSHSNEPTCEGCLVALAVEAAECAKSEAAWQQERSR